MGNIERFGHFEIARGADGLPIELPRSAEEVVFLAFDVRIGRIVELHVLKPDRTMTPLEKQAAGERIRMAREVTSTRRLRILNSGDDHDAVYYSASLSDGERLGLYVARRGALPAPATFGLVLSLLDDLIVLQRYPELLTGIRLDGLQMTLEEDTFLQLRIMDFGFAHAQGEMADCVQRLAREICENLFLLLTGKPYAGDDCDKYPVLNGLPTGLRAAIRGTLGNSTNFSVSLERLRDGVRESLNVITRDVGQRSARRHLVATDAMVPRSTLRDVLLENVPLEKLLGGRLTVGEELESRRYPFSVLASDARTDAPLTVHLLPPRRIVSNEHYDAVPLQMWRFSPDKHPNILRSLSVWESPDITFLTEERGPGFPLSRLIAERVQLNPSEVVILLRQVKMGIGQARECGVDKLDLHPSNMVLRLAGQPPAREMDRLLQKRLDAWPKFQLMVRPHVTMRNLYEPLLLDFQNEDGADGEGINPKDFWNCSFVALAAYLLSGEQQTTGEPRLPDSVPAPLTEYVLDSLSKCRQRGEAPEVERFLAEFETRAVMQESYAEAGEISLPVRRGAIRSVVATGPVESAGSISDFEEDADHPGSADALIPEKDAMGFQHPGFRAARPLRKGSMTLWLWAVGTAVFAILMAIWLKPRASEAKPPGTGENTLLPTDPASPDGATGRSRRHSEEVRKALLPTEEEKAALRKKQSSVRSEMVRGLTQPPDRNGNRQSCKGHATDRPRPGSLSLEDRPRPGSLWLEIQEAGHVRVWTSIPT